MVINFPATLHKEKEYNTTQKGKPQDHKNMMNLFI